MRGRDEGEGVRKDVSTSVLVTPLICAFACLLVATTNIDMVAMLQAIRQARSLTDTAVVTIALR